MRDLPRGEVGDVSDVSKDRFFRDKMFSAIRVRNKEKALLLIGRGGADVDKEDSSGVTLLQWAAVDDEREAVSFLIQNGADVNKGAEFSG